MLSLNLYVKGCLDCTIGAFHMSIPAESSLLQEEAQILNAKSCKPLSEKIFLIIENPFQKILSH